MLCTNYKGEQELYSPLHYIELQYTILCDVLEKTIIICLYSLHMTFIFYQITYNQLTSN